MGIPGHVTKIKPNGTELSSKEQLNMMLLVLPYNKFLNLKKICTLFFVTLLKKLSYFCCKRLSHPNVLGFCSSEVGDESLAVDDSSCNQKANIEYRTNEHDQITRIHCHRSDVFFYTAVSRKVVLQKCKSVRATVEGYYG